MTDNDLWFLGAYLIGTFMGWYFSKVSASQMAELTIDHLIEGGFLKYEKNDRGEIVLLKLDEEVS